ncbi:MAG: hypothetical protein CM15mP109_15960 [Candidatus Dadabacteria bacterium]|nr:MAG: hypothetical protein CM15mP109_15960 [Candidatus Dadabacteria bacterium]
MAIILAAGGGGGAGDHEVSQGFGGAGGGTTGQQGGYGGQARSGSDLVVDNLEEDHIQPLGGGACSGGTSLCSGYELRGGQSCGNSPVFLVEIKDALNQIYGGIGTAV